MDMRLLVWYWISKYLISFGNNPFFFLKSSLLYWLFCCLWSRWHLMKLFAVFFRSISFYHAVHMLMLLFLVWSFPKFYVPNYYATRWILFNVAMCASRLVWFDNDFMTAVTLPGCRTSLWNNRTLIAAFLFIETNLYRF